MTEVLLTKGRSPAATYVTVGRTTYLFSYETCVAFRVAGDRWVASENVWSQATGKHIGEVAPPSARIPHDRFKAALQRVSERLLQVTP
jgi:hypothetical protein